MKHTFVLDENVVIEAFNGDETCVNIMIEIDRNCHYLAVDSRMWGKYSAHMDSLKAQGQAPCLNIAKLLADIWSRDPEKPRYEPDPPVFDREEEVPRKDVPILRLTAAVHGILVTRDGGLLALNDTSTAQRLGIGIMAPEQALGRAKQRTHGQA